MYFTYTCFPCMIGRDCALGGKVVSGLQQSLHLKPVRNSCLEGFMTTVKETLEYFGSP